MRPTSPSPAPETDFVTRAEFEALRRIVIDRIYPPTPVAPPIDLEARMTLAEVAKEVGRTARTLEGWIHDPRLRVRFKAHILLCKRAGRWESSRAMLRDWRAAMQPPASIAWPAARRHSTAPGPRRIHTRTPSPGQDAAGGFPENVNTKE